jgi:hypothetical protein
LNTPPTIQPLFATPIALFDVPNAVVLNGELKRIILEREKVSEGTAKSNRGGWQSSPDMESWGGTAAITLLSWGRNVANRITTDREGNAGGGPHPGFIAVTWRANMWANINRSGDSNEFHSHPGAYWSAVYYVDDGGIAADPALGGELEFLDPRGALPVMLGSHLRVAMPGGLAAGGTDRIQPKAGRLVMFPAWLMHQVRPYRGTAERISIAFNLTL